MIFSKYKITSLFGYRTLDNGDNRFHNGIDVVGIENKYVLSPVEGIVRSSTIVTDKKNSTWEWGNYIRIDTSDGYKHFFCHLKTRNVKVGDIIKKGDIIGVMGNTGYSFGEHTHYGVRDKNDRWIDPLEYFSLSLKEDIVYIRDLETEDKKTDLEKEIEVVTNKRYKNITDMPSWLQVYVKSWVDKGYIKGNTTGELDFTEDMLRCLIISERMMNS